MGWGRRGFWEDHLVFGGNRGNFKCQSSPTEYEGGEGRGGGYRELIVSPLPMKGRQNKSTEPNGGITWLLLWHNQIPLNLTPSSPPLLILKAINKDHSLRGFIYNHAFFFSNENVPLTHKLWHDTWEECSQNFPDDIQDENHATIIIYLFLTSLCLNFPDLTSGR